eukprot:gene13884-16378_t
MALLQQSLLTIVLFISVLVGICQADLIEGYCKFAPLFTTDDIKNSPAKRAELMKMIIHYEGNFHSDNVGVNVATGMTIDGCSIDWTTGNWSSPRRYGAPSKESLHLAIIALALNGKTSEGYDALDYFHLPIERTDDEKAKIPSTNDARLDNLFTILYRKMDTIEITMQNYPCLGGWQPWGGSGKNGISVSDVNETLPSLDNGEMVWGIYAVTHVLEDKYPQFSAIATRYRAYLDQLASSAMSLFYDKNGGISMETTITNPILPFNQCQYVSGADGKWYLDDMYEGELMAVFFDLYASMPTSDSDALWALKTENYRSRVYKTPVGDVTYAEGYTFSAHEQWKYLMLPYQSIPLHNRILLGSEKVRTWFSKANSYPGLFAAMYNTTLPDEPPASYAIYFGVRPAAMSGQINDYSSFTPYGITGLGIVDHVAALAWYHNMISGPKMQGPYGSTEGGSNDGKRIAPKLSWDTKGTGLVSLLGGIGNIVKAGLIKDGKYNRFVDKLNSTYATEFTSFVGDQVPMAYPEVTIPQTLGDFTTCPTPPPQVDSSSDSLSTGTTITNSRSNPIIIMITTIVISVIISISL